MQTKDILVFGALVYLFFMLRKKTTSCNCQPGGSMLDNNNIPNNASCCNCGSAIDLKSLIVLPKFTTVNKQTEPTPASVLNPIQLLEYKARSIKGISQNQTYIC